jgi:hypothetical protein
MSDFKIGDLVEVDVDGDDGPTTMEAVVIGFDGLELVLTMALFKADPASVRAK